MKKLKENIGVVMVILGLIGSTGAGFSKFAKMEAQINVLSKKQAPDLTIISTLNTQVKIMETEIKLLKIQIEEVKENNKNPLR
jgi:hypothetical protein|tara:strand:+ start:66 stop:314 length:249 start_codon:yes stop_codon:yes gene_type:complete